MWRTSGVTSADVAYSGVTSADVTYPMMPLWALKKLQFEDCEFFEGVVIHYSHLFFWGYLVHLKQILKKNNKMKKNKKCFPIARQGKDIDGTWAGAGKIVFWWHSTLTVEATCTKGTSLLCSCNLRNGRITPPLKGTPITPSLISVPIQESPDVCNLYWVYTMTNYSKQTYDFVTNP